MIIGVPKEIKKGEYRVGITPSGVEELRRDKYIILIETGAGEGSNLSDGEYQEAGGNIVEREKIFQKAELIVKINPKNAVTLS